MKTIRLAMLALSLVAVMAAMAFSEGSTAPSAATPVKKLHNQTVCPVMGNPIDSAAYTDIQGQRVYHCCKGCSAKLTADPDKYFKQAAAEGVLFQNIQKTCPISGDSLTDQKNFTDYEGRRIYFCCSKCVDKFTAAPQKYLKMMDEPASTDKPAMKMDMKVNMQDTSGHSHK